CDKLFFVVGRDDNREFHAKGCGHCYLLRLPSAEGNVQSWGKVKSKKVKVKKLREADWAKKKGKKKLKLVQSNKVIR
ncbi:MAG: hypothetical protein ACE10C_03060, partial [Candidatus Binatia bacterium]